MKHVAALLLFASTASAAPQEALALALADARAIGDHDTAVYTRYLDGTHLPPERLAAYQRMACRLQPNLLSNAPRKYVPRFFADGTMVAIDLRYIARNKADYARVHTTWEKFLSREPYYHQRKVIYEQTPPDAYGRANPPKQILKTFYAEFLPGSQYEELRKTVNSYTPIVTMDWFFAMTCIEADRGGNEGAKFVGGGFGYYDFLGIKNRDDYFKLAGVNLDSGRSKQSELLAVVLGHNSGVATNDRMIVRRAAEDGFLWYTLDFFDNNLDERNPLAILDPTKGLKHQAERHFATLPNGLPVVIACTDKGELQTYAPGEIGGDTSARGKDLRIHSAKSCLSCHGNGFLKDINDEVKAIYKFEPNKGYNLLSAPEKEEELKLHDAYLRDFRAKLEFDRVAYETAVREIVGYPPENGQPVKMVTPLVSAEYRECYQWYASDPVTMEQVCQGLGVTVEDFKAKLKAYRKNDQLSSHILAPLSLDPPRPVTRNNYELLYPLLQAMTRGIPVEVPVVPVKQP